jgi:60 kDa SS-A/Ro ribonucleoprotein
MLGDSERIKKSRIHPLNILVAAKTYESGHGSLGSLSWDPNAKILKALDGAFRLAFGNVQATGQRIMLGLDVSGSMTTAIVGMSNKRGKGIPLSSREASAALALITANVEERHLITGFTAGGTAVVKGNKYNLSGISQLAIHPHDRLTDVCGYTARLGFAGTDLSLPMLYALEKDLSFDAFIVYTDNECNHGILHPSQALKLYRERTGIPAKLVVVAMSSDGFSIADPNDAGMLDVVGFDLATPHVIAGFLGGATAAVEDD